MQQKKIVSNPFCQKKLSANPINGNPLKNNGLLLGIYAFNISIVTYKIQKTKAAKNRSW